MPDGEELLPRLLPEMPLLVPGPPVPGGRFRENPACERNRPMTEYGQDEILELVWTLREEGRANRSQLLQRTEEDQPERLLDELAASGLVETRGDEVRLTRAGEDRARGIIRR